MIDTAYDFPLFEGITDAELQWLVTHSQERRVEVGDCIFTENEPAEEFYVVLEGELQITRTVEGKEVVLGTTPRGIINGELRLLNLGGWQSTACAILPTRLMIFDVGAFRRIFSEVPLVGARILQTAIGRMSSYTTGATQREKLSALGKLSAGLAHELNNPAAAARRAAKTLQEIQPEIQVQTMKLYTEHLSELALTRLAAFPSDVVAAAAQAAPLGPLEQSDREDEIARWLGEQGLADSWELPSTFVSSGVTLDKLQELVAQFPAESVADALNWLCKALEAVTLLDEIEHSTRRISDLVSAVKEYTYMDRAEAQEVDVHRGLDSTLKILNHKLKNIRVVREYDPQLPKVWGTGGELNQVWTNLIDNAIDAMQGEGTLRLITRNENAYVMVEVNDSGPGIPPNVLPHIWEPFFTTKEVGSGTGLGLDITYRIVRQHNATIEVQSKPGETRFIVRLPIQANGSSAG